MSAETLVAGLRRQGIRDPRILDAIRSVPRDQFVPGELRQYAWDDEALPIGLGQTISQPFVVAFTLESLELTGRERVLELGTGSGYQTALLAGLCAEVYSIELHDELLQQARRRLIDLGFAANVQFRVGDGYRGWPEASPFDAIVVSAAVSRIPDALVQQLADGGRLNAPVGGALGQDLLLVERRAGVLESRRLLPVRFVPLVHPHVGN